MKINSRLSNFLALIAFSVALSSLTGVADAALFNFTGFVNALYDSGIFGVGYTDFGNFTGFVPVFNLTPVVAAVPEPSIWAMMILGSIGVSFVTYRRRRPAAALVA